MLYVEDLAVWIHILVKDSPHFSLYISGPKAGEAETFIDNLPGFPDNIRLSTQGTFYVGLGILKDPFRLCLHNKFSKSSLPRQTVAVRYARSASVGTQIAGYCVSGTLPRSNICAIQVELWARCGIRHQRENHRLLSRSRRQRNFGRFSGSEFQVGIFMKLF